MGYTPKVTCAGDDEFKEWIRKITFQEIIISTYVDTSDYGKPIHYFLDDIWISMDPIALLFIQNISRKIFKS